MAYRQIVDELHTRLSAHGYSDIPPNFGYVLLALHDQPMTNTAIASLLGVTKQATSKLVDAMADGGYVSRAARDDDGRAKSVVISARGKRFLTTVESIYEEIETEWAQIASKRRVDAMHDGLRAIVEARHAGQLPIIRPAR
jgi:DNA-binding MarR family transcriptional regulator